MTFFDFVVHVPTRSVSYCAAASDARARASERVTTALSIEEAIIILVFRGVKIAGGVDGRMHSVLKGARISD